MEESGALFGGEIKIIIIILIKNTRRGLLGRRGPPLLWVVGCPIRVGPTLMWANLSSLRIDYA